MGDSQSRQDVKRTPSFFVYRSTMSIEICYHPKLHRSFISLKSRSVWVKEEVMSLDTWVMMGGWNFLDQFQVNEFLDKVEEVDVSHLAFGGTPPVRPDPRHDKDSMAKGQEPPAEIMRYAGRVRSPFCR